ncbi:MAG: phosphatase PAP2 family protein [Oscillospiraceae bacterium]|nr:phosphatase PAP2 family protein [Oscillospiraceae bacterium]
MNILNNIEASILLFLQQIRNPITDPIMTVFSVLGNFGLIWIIIAVILLLRKKTRRHGIQLALCLVASLIINNLILKNLVARPRPFTEIEGLTVMLSQHLADAGSWSFPSGHAGSSFAAAWSLNCSFAKKARWSWIVAALIAFSRSYIGVHYLSDIIGGAFFGTVAAILAVMLWRRLTPAAEKLNII